jgi:D-glycero-D-manno-heptose 1,7-bisphosphate phosphatase
VQPWKIKLKSFKNTDLVILVGGLGSRIKHITKKIPKPLIKFGKYSFLQNLINYYAKFNFNKIYLLAGYKGEKIKKKFNNKKINLTPIECIIEKSLKGTAGSLYELKKKKINDFFLINGDSFFELDFNKFKKNINNKLIKIALVKNKNYRSNNTLRNLEVKKNIVFFKKVSKFMNGGVYYINKKFLKKIKNETKSLENDFLHELIKNKKVYGQKFFNDFIDIGTKDSLNKSYKKFKKLFKRPAFFLDRDGVINHDYGHVNKLKNFKLKKGVIEGLKLILKKKYLIFIVTNQAGIGKGFYKEKDFIKFQKKIYQIFNEKNIFFSDTQYCPHHPQAKIKVFKKNCKCRKPGNLLIKNILSNYNIDIKKSFMIGDQLTDLKCAKKSKLKFYYTESDFKKLILKILY